MDCMICKLHCNKHRIRIKYHHPRRRRHHHHHHHLIEYRNVLSGGFLTLLKPNEQNSTEKWKWTSNCSKVFFSSEGIIFEICPRTYKILIISELLSKSRSLHPIQHINSKISILYLHVTCLINHSLQSGTVPCCFKNAVIRTLMNKLNFETKELRNYRPVFYLPILRKSCYCSFVMALWK